MVDPLLIKRTHGLGNVLLLLPVLLRLLEQGRAVRLLTRPEWVEVAAALLPESVVDAWEPELARVVARAGGFVDLDALTLRVRPVEHRTLELARLLGVSGPLPVRPWSVPEAWSRPFERLRGAVLFAVEAGHPARQWPWEHVRALAGRLVSGNGSRPPLVLTGLRTDPPLPCDLDLRGGLRLPEMLGLASVASRMISLDSGALHMATGLGLPCVAVFGGLEPRHRILPSQRAVALQADLPCAPCNKKETCDGRMDCLRTVEPDHVLAALETLQHSRGLEVRRVASGRPPARERRTPWAS